MHPNPLRHKDLRGSRTRRVQTGLEFGLQRFVQGAFHYSHFPTPATSIVFLVEFDDFTVDGAKGGHYIVRAAAADDVGKGAKIRQTVSHSPIGGLLASCDLRSYSLRMPMLRHLTALCDAKNHILCTSEGYLDVPSYMAGIASGLAVATLIGLVWYLVAAWKRRSAVTGKYGRP